MVAWLHSLSSQFLNFFTFNPFINMLWDALCWNMLNVIRVELFFNCYNIWNIFMKSSIQSPQGQYACISLFITLLAHLAVQFNFAWMLTLYIFYLLTGMIVWIYKRVFFYHRKLDSAGVVRAISEFESSKSSANNYTQNGSATLKSSDKHHNSNGSSTSSAASVCSATSTNSLHRLRTDSYKRFQLDSQDTRCNHREFALSLAHLSSISKLVADKDVFDEMHFQILATRRDVVNMIVRFALLSSATCLALFR